MALTVTPTLNLTSTPPSISLQVTDSTGTVTSATVTRYPQGSAPGTVRTTDGGPLPLTTSGSTKVGSLVDYEAPYGVPVQYSADGGKTLSAAVILGVIRPWLVHPTTPSLSMQITLRPGSLTQETRPVVQGVFQPLGRKFPVVVTDGSAKAAQSQLVVLTQSTAEFAQLKALLAPAFPLLLNIPATLDWGFDTSYIAVGDHKPQRVQDKLFESWRDNTLTFYVVEAPISGSAATAPGSGPVGARTWADLAVERSTWKNAETAYSLWSKAEAGTPG